MLLSTGLQRVGHDLATEQQHSYYPSPINGGENECMLLDVKDTEEGPLPGKE